METTSTQGAGRGLLWGGIGGIVFAAAFVVGILLMTDKPDSDASNAEWRRYFLDSENRKMIVAGAFVLALAAIGFLVFLGVLRERLRSSSPGVEWASTVAFASGVAFVVILVVAGAALSTVAAGVEIGDGPVPRDADIMRNFEGLGFGLLLVFGASSAGLLIVTSSVAGGRTALLPRWLVVTGYVVGVIVIVGGWLFIPMVLFVVWMLVISIIMITRSRAA